ncbi:hypothetical protein [Microseira sp. BLCC-F43]|jgi:hypothetical protein|uniref:hypothetical protein n=1 Tax=Microseira sp. BLCC-F43 TaxID=3153602 RepID=UPI0035B800C2
MVEPIGDRWCERSSEYQQALHDFCITQLLCCISNYSDGDFNATGLCLKAQEAQRIAALLIEQVSANLKGYVLAGYLNTIRNQERLHRPWVIVRLLPGAKTHQIARFFHRQDADDQVRTLRRYVPQAVFEIVFEPPER